MDVIHFTHRATDPLRSLDSSGARFLPLADGNGNSHISCLHLEMNGKIESPSITHTAALLVVHGRITVETRTPQIRIDIHAGSGCIVEKGETYSLMSEEGAILLIVESQELSAHARAMSTPQRIAGATWPRAEITDAVV
jgi:redox-sensitive bicupin YhaK (pirin superfamily)